MDVVRRGLFAVPMLEYVWPDSERLNKDLAKVAMRDRAENLKLGGVASNRGGFHSFRDIHKKRPKSCIFILLERIKEQAQEYKAGDFSVSELWINVNGKGDHNAPHDHIGGTNVVSGYYVVAGNTGKTVLENRVADKVLTEHPINPQPGLMVLFPAYVWHHVEPYEGKGFRISYAFNLVRENVVL